MAADHPKLAEQGLQLKKAGNAIVSVGRRTRDPSRQPPSRRVLPGAYAPASCAAKLGDQLERARELALETVRWSSRLDLPGGGLGARARRTARARPLPDRPRGDRLKPRTGHRAGRVQRVHRRGARRALQRASRPDPRARQLPVRPAGALQPLIAMAVAARSRGRARRRTRRAMQQPVPEHRRARRRDPAGLRRGAAIIDGYEPPDQPAVEVIPRDAVGHGATEAPRGMLYHRYEIDEEGTILDAKIVPPTSQNQRAIEEDLRAVVQRNVEPSGRAAAATLRAGDPQPRSVHLVRDPLPRFDRRSGLSRVARSVVVIGIGNELRGDDAAGLVVARRLRRARPARGSVCSAHEGEAIELLELLARRRGRRAGRHGALGCTGGRRSIASTPGPSRSRRPAARTRATRSGSPRRSSSRGCSSGCRRLCSCMGSRGTGSRPAPSSARRSPARWMSWRSRSRSRSRSWPASCSDRSPSCSRFGLPGSRPSPTA